MRWIFSIQYQAVILWSVNQLLVALALLVGSKSCWERESVSNWFADPGITVLDWPANSPDLTYCQEEDERHQSLQYRWTDGGYWSNLGFHRIWAVPLMLKFVQKEPGPSIECMNEHTSQKFDNSELLILFFVWSYVITQYLEILEFWFSLAVSRNHHEFNKKKKRAWNISLYV